LIISFRFFLLKEVFYQESLQHEYVKSVLFNDCENGSWVAGFLVKDVLSHRIFYKSMK